MGFLRILGLVAIGIGLFRHVIVTVFLADRRADGDDGFLTHADAIGPHIGDQADGLTAERNTFIQFLCGAHGAGRAEAKFPRRFLLHGRCREWRCRTSVDGFALDRFDGVAVLFNLGDGGLGSFFVAKIVAVELLAVQMRQPCWHGGAACRRKRGGFLQHRWTNPEIR